MAQLPDTRAIVYETSASKRLVVDIYTYVVRPRPTHFQSRPVGDHVYMPPKMSSTPSHGRVIPYGRE